MASKLVRKLSPYSWFICLFFIIATYISFPHAIRLMGAISTDLADLLPDDFESVKAANEIKSAFKKTGGGDLILLVNSPNPDENLKIINGLAAHLTTFPEVERVQITKKGYNFFDRHKLLYIDLEDLKDIKDRIDRKIQREKLGPFYIDLEDDGKSKDFSFDDIVEKYKMEYKREVDSAYYTNPDKTVYALWVYPANKDGSLKFYKTFLKLVEEKVSLFPWQDYDPSVRVLYAGSIRTRIDEYSALISDLKRAGTISIIGIVILLFLFLRNPIGVFLIFLPLASGILIGFGICSFFFDHMNLVTSFLFAILFGLGVDIGIHMYSRYAKDREDGLSMEMAIENILFKTGRSSATAVLTTAASFFVLVLNDFRGFSEFGWIAGIGLVSTFLVYMIFFPALLYGAEKIRILRFRKSDQKSTGYFSRLSGIPYDKKIIWGGASLSVLCLLASPFIRFEWNYGLLKIHIPETEEARALLKTVSNRVNRPAAFLVSSEEEAGALKSHFEGRKLADTEKQTIDYFRSSYDLFPKQQEEKISVLKEIEVLLKDDALRILKGSQKEMVNDFRKALHATRPFTKKEIPMEVQESFVGEGGDGEVQLAFVYPRPDLELGDGRHAIDFYNDVHKVSVAGKTYHAVSDAIIFADVLRTTFRDAKQAILLTFLAMLFFIYMDFKNWRKTFLVFGCLFSGILWLGGIMVVFGLKFNFYNMITIPLMMGMGEDNSVHLLHRFEEMGKRSVLGSLTTSGKAALLSSLTTMLGYFGLMFTHHPGLNSIGILAVIGMATCVLSSLVFLPAIMQRFMLQSPSH